ncbi:MAG TPA: hypothetical protein DIW47_08520 [Bacteroidetes bacterium]|nr:hypothetical protein [Bacteroidota bacterium]
MKYILLALPLLFACEGKLPFKEVEPTTTDPVIRARELNDSAIDLFTKNSAYGDNALAVFDASIALDSSYDKPHINKIAVLMQLRRFDAAQKAAETLRLLRPADADLLVLTGMLFRLEGDSANAVEYFSAATGMYQNNMANLDSLAPVYQGEKNKLALVHWIMGHNAESERYAPGMTSEERPTDEIIAAEFWKGLQPQ